MDMFKAFQLEPDDEIDLAILNNLMIDGFQYLEDTLVRLHTVPEKDYYLEMYNMYLKIQINDNFFDFLEYLEKKENSNLWNHFIEHDLGIQDFLEKYIICNKHTITLKIFSNIESSDNLQNAIINIINSDAGNNGKKYENNSLLTLFNCDNFDNILLQQYINCIIKIYNCEQVQNHLILYLFRILKSNTYYTHINITYDTLAKCSSINFLASLLLICVNLYEINKTTYDKQINQNNLDRTDFQIYESDNLDTKIFYLMNYSVCVCFTPLFALKKSFQKKLQSLLYFESYSLFSKISYESQKLKLENEIITIDEMIMYPKINNTIIELYESLSTILENNPKILTENILHSIYNYFANMLYELKNDQFSDSIYNFFENIANGKYFQNPHVRYQCSSLLFKMNRSCGNTSLDSIRNYMKYYTEVTYTDWTHYAYADNHTISFLESFDICLRLIHSQLDISDVLCRSFIYKLCSNGIADCSTINFLEKDLERLIIEHNMILGSSQHKQLLEDFHDQTKKIIKKLTLISVMVNNILNYMDITIAQSEIVQQLINFEIEALKIYHNDTFKYQDIDHNAHKETLDRIISYVDKKPLIIEYLAQLYNIQCFDKKFQDFIQSYSHIYELIKAYNQSTITGTSKKQTAIIYPEDFLDPILYIKITDPIMIPGVNSVFDRSSITTHLYTNHTNPFTREELTEEQLNEYNKKDEIIAEIQKFKNKLYTFEENYKKIN